MYRFAIWLIALALMFNGVFVSAWNGEPMAASAIAQNQHADDAGVRCDTQGNQTAAVAQHSDRSHGPMHNHVKCCGMCNVASVVPAMTAIPVAFAYRNAVFHVGQPHLVGHLVALDPDIPKFVG